MRAHPARACRPESKAVGIAEISIRNGNTYCIEVGDLIRGRPIEWGEEDRRQAGGRYLYLSGLRENSSCGTPELAQQRRHPAAVRRLF